MVDRERQFDEFADYFTARRDTVRRSAYLLCGDWHRADDLTQTAFVALYRRWHTIRDKGALDAYVRRCVVRAAVDESRRPWRRERFTDRPPDSATGVGVDTEVADRDALLSALRQVPARQRAVLVLRYLEDLDVATTARALRCSEGTVKSQAARGLAALRDRLGDTVAQFRPGKATGEGQEVSGRG
ncbi:MAG: SigE family RNA polymerase sigma factor [Sciscionella sp.]